MRVFKMIRKLAEALHVVKECERAHEETQELRRPVVAPIREKMEARDRESVEHGVGSYGTDS